MTEYSDLNALLDHIVTCIHQNQEVGEIKFDDNLKPKIIVHGSQWDGYADARVAQFIIDLQNAVSHVYEESLDVTNEELLNAIKRSMLVKISISDGSMEAFWNNAKDILNAIFHGMSGNQKTFIAALMLMCATGYFSVAKWSETQSETLQAIQHEETKRILAQTIEHQADLLIDMEKPIRGIVNKMGEGDTIKLPQSEEMIPKNQAQSLYPRRPRLQVRTDYIDANYAITNIKYHDDGVDFVIESQSGKPIKAIVDLNDDDTARLYQHIKQCHQNGETPCMDLQVTAKYTRRSIRSATVVGLGQPRENSKPLETLFQ